MRVHIVTVSLLALCASTACGKLTSKGGAADGGDPATGGPLGASLAFLDGFEGEIDAFVKETSKGGQPTPMSLFLKSGKMRFQVPEQMAKSAGPMLGEHAYVIFDGTAKKMSVVDDAKKEALVIDLSTSGKSMPPFGPHEGFGPHRPGMPGEPPATPTKVTKTGKFDTVAGYKCENWDISSDHREGTVCVADQGASWLSIPMTGIPTEHAWMLELLDGKHFPLRFVGYAKDGTTEESRMEITKIDKKSQPDAEFEVPAGYKTIDLEKMFQGMPGMPGGFPMPPHPGPRPR